MNPANTAWPGEMRRQGYARTRAGHRRPRPNPAELAEGFELDEWWAEPGNLGVVRRGFFTPGRRHVLAASGYRCAYCGEQAQCTDHVIPIARGGPDHPWNLAACCSPCNTSKANRMPWEWRSGVSRARAAAIASD